LGSRRVDREKEWNSVLFAEFFLSVMLFLGDRITTPINFAVIGAVAAIYIVAYPKKGVRLQTRTARVRLY
jgi:hypothetical protein